MVDWKSIERQIGDSIGAAFTIQNKHSVSGGCINAAYRIEGETHTFFVKLNDAEHVQMFAAEAEGLRELRRAAVIRTPQPICWGCAGQAYLVLQYIPLHSDGDQVRLGRAMAALHRITHPQFGWKRDNTIGATTQINTQHSTWVAFYAQHRLRYQLDLAARKGGARVQKNGEALLTRLDAFFTEQPCASLLHGDLWGGNRAFDDAGAPVIYDPAVYYGDREADIAMTELFGGFSPDFYAAYAEAYPLLDGYETRKTLYNLYHILNHFNLFGGGYLAQAQGMIEQLLAQVR